MVQTVPAEDFARTNSQNVTDTLQQQILGAVAIDVNGNDFAQDLRYRGFVASPIQGTPQGLAVYQNGIRVNEAFGDTVNWALISPQAIYRADLFTNNPVFGLNALGGAVSLQMKNGYLWQGLTPQIMGGSYASAGSLNMAGKLTITASTSPPMRRTTAFSRLPRFTVFMAISATARRATSFTSSPLVPAVMSASSVPLRSS
jgi:iron complex outermembrane receptor protein